MLYICYAEDFGYYLLNEQGFIHSCNIFSEYYDAEKYCERNGYMFDCGMED